MERFKQIYNDRYAIANEHKERGQRIMGWVCTYVPEEIIYASGAFPFRILGGNDPETPMADAHLYSNVCSFVRSCFEERLKGDLDFLDGFIGVTSCDHIRRLYDVWDTFSPARFTRIMGVPCKVSKATLKYFAKDILHLKEGLEEEFNITISEDTVFNAIKTYNDTRRLLYQLYDWRKTDPPKIFGWEASEIIRASWFLPKNEFNNMLTQFIRDFEGGQGAETKKKGGSNGVPERPEEGNFRLMVVGSELDDPRYIKAIEDLGATVVVDDLCCGSRYFWEFVAEDGDPYLALSQRYLTRPYCPRTHPHSIRGEHLKRLAKEYKVDGVILQSIKFCDSHAASYPMVRDDFKELDIPIIYVEREYTFSGAGQLKTRVQAFLELLEERR
jgi:bzd-type benzoyl-CoA reductase N subunit